MSQVLEATMLVCFGLSWPVSVIKNIKAKTAKSMSLQFILLIITGYVAGIAAKIFSHNINYVLIIYLLNLLVVSANVVVYFINKRYDAATEKVRPETYTKQAAVVTEDEEMNSKIISYKEMNDMSKSGGIVFFGSNTFADLPVNELSESYNLGENIYNRSVCDKNIEGAAKLLNTCVFDLNPSKVFINLGDADLKDTNLNIDEFIASYEWILYSIHTNTHAEIYVVSVISNSPVVEKINKRLEMLALESGSGYIDAASVISSVTPKKDLFDLLKLYIRTHPLSFADAMRK